MNSPSSSSFADSAMSTQSVLESVAAVRDAGNERGLSAFLRRAELAKVGPLRHLTWHAASVVSSSRAASV